MADKPFGNRVFLAGREELRYLIDDSDVSGIEEAMHDGVEFVTVVSRDLMGRPKCDVALSTAHIVVVEKHAVVFASPAERVP
jgi:hypothetical protein